MRRLHHSAVLVLSLVLFTGANALASLDGYFISTEKLAAAAGTVKIVDVRAMPLYLAGHIGGAVHLDRAEFLDTRRGVKSLIPTVPQIEKLLDSLGISDDDTVVAYADHGNPYSARLVWTLRFHGHEKSYALDGGYEKWAAEGRGTALLPTFPRGTEGYTVRAHRDLRADKDEIYATLGTPAVAVWDTRSAGEYTGTDVRADRGGHIPTAIHLDWRELQEEVDGVRVLKSENQIRALLAARGLTPERRVIAHCQTGIRSAYATLVLTGLGYPHPKNYDGSWIEWANEPSLPVQVGPETGDIPRT
ncbi:MAG: sulfurtransferase [Deferrisomatales bacterium]|nr:sulfurtransferase [Deferrisomatales bacterium]